jgi:hypothetical protein
MTTDAAAILFSCTALGTLFLLGLFLADLRSKYMLKEWGRSNGFEILSHEERWHFKHAARGKSVFRVTVLDSVGRRRSGYAQCGLRWLGLLPDNVVVRWDD